MKMVIVVVAGSAYSEKSNASSDETRFLSKAAKRGRMGKLAADALSLNGSGAAARRQLSYQCRADASDCSLTL